MKAKNLGRLELLAWLNESVDVDYPKIEHCSDGVAYCQILDAIHPNTVPLYKLNFMAKHKDDFTRNLKVLDDCVQKLKLQKLMSIPLMANGKLSQNMDFI